MWDNQLFLKYFNNCGDAKSTMMLKEQMNSLFFVVELCPLIGLLMECKYSCCYLSRVSCPCVFVPGAVG